MEKVALGTYRMDMLILLFLAGLAIGSIVTYFFAWPVLLILSVIVVICFWKILPDGKTGGNSGQIGALLITTPLLIGLLFGIWVTAFVLSWGHVFTGIIAFWEIARPYILR